MTWRTPQVAGSPTPGPTKISLGVRLTSGQPIVGADFQFSGFHPIPCALLPK